AVAGRWDSLFSGAARRELEAWLPTYVAGRRWFGHKARRITSATVLDAVTVPDRGDGANGAREARPPVACVLVVQLELDHDPPERYLLPLAYATGAEADEVRRWHPDAVVADVRSADEDGVVIDAVHAPGFVRAMADLLARRRTLSGSAGQLTGVPHAGLRRLHLCTGAECPTTPLSGEQSNTSVLLGDEAILKFVRRMETGVNPGVEVAQFLAEHPAPTPRFGGSIEYRRHGASESATVGILEELVANEEDGWDYVVDALTHGLEESLANPRGADAPSVVLSRGVVTPLAEDPEAAHPLVGPHLQWASLLGRRTAELHLALVSDVGHPDFAPEPLTSLDRQALFHGARSLTRQVLADLADDGVDSPLVSEVVRRGAEVAERLRRLTSGAPGAYRIRCHGDFHLGQVLWTGKDFVLIDFEGEPSRSLAWRRLKRPAAVDLAGMLRSIHYAGEAAARRIDQGFGPTLEQGDEARHHEWVALWRTSVGACFLESYLGLASQSPYLPASADELDPLLDFFTLEKAVAELRYEANSRPTWVDLPAKGILDLLDAEP
ncbi:MAG TPA: phosphotransferase, partial [Acidimicrobiales bacterium]|nr:phosphotransferase [Acidimicrobiales bacterium]